MRGVYLEPQPHDYDVLFSQRGGGVGGSLAHINTYRPQIQRGGSIFGVLGRVIKRTIPFLKNIFFPEIPNFVNNVSSDLQTGMRFKDSVKRQGIRSAKNVGRRILKKARGGRKTKRSNRKTKKTTKKKKRKIVRRTRKDLFSSLSKV